MGATLPVPKVPIELDFLVKVGLQIVLGKDQLEDPPEVRNWINIYSSLDPLSGKIKRLGLSDMRQKKLGILKLTRHREVDEYVEPTPS